MITASEGSHPDLAPDRKQRAQATTETTVGRAARPASLAFPLRPASSRGDRGPRHNHDALGVYPGCPGCGTDWSLVASPSQTVVPDSVDDPFYYGEPSVYVQAAPSVAGLLRGVWALFRRVLGLPREGDLR